MDLVHELTSLDQAFIKPTTKQLKFNLFTSTCNWWNLHWSESFWRDVKLHYQSITLYMTLKKRNKSSRISTCKSFPRITFCPLLNSTVTKYAVVTHLHIKTMHLSLYCRYTAVTVFREQARPCYVDYARHSYCRSLRLHFLMARCLQQQL